jgi:hypothetical protein
LTRLVAERSPASYWPEVSGLTQRIALGWHAKPMLEQIDVPPSASRVQLTHSSVHRLQFGGPFCIETFSAGRRGGMSSSAVRTLELANPDIARRATIKTKCRMPLSDAAYRTWRFASATRPW